ncbi:MAG: hypothetical protein A3K19_32995 [Lentisphaerae bacterium RIFOXYB12_FULL_65_16]|nr:MAG: hypothetical protein A3K18_31630 [Lentisphaerae bacterium RIFOXYA12_64_32]OGV87007.1 MAG: hypothetical protein A3K19_32995 [Lentisphaerae bacterium RIFOXYB12_FULL_65_16]
MPASADAVGGDVLAQSADVLSRNGRVVSIVDPDGVRGLNERGVNAQFVFVRPEPTELSTLAAMIEARRLRTFVSATFLLEEAPQALELSQAGHVRGKVALLVSV